MSARITALNLIDITDYLANQPEVTRRSARIAINQVTARNVVPDARKAMREEVNFPSGYLENPDRFGQTKKATDADLTAIVTARHRPTSLARFSSNSFEGARRTGQVSVAVNRGGARRLNRAFFVRLRRGGDTADGFNLGLAVRLKPGERLKGRKKGNAGVELAPGLFLLYGPSVDQVFRQVSVAESPKIADKLTKEFLRQYIRNSGQK